MSGDSQAFCRLEGVRKTWPDFDLEASISCNRGEQLALLGPSGSGKSTLLRIMAGLMMPDQGRMWLDGRDITDLPARKRGIGLVFQDFALFPHMNVGENVAYGLRVKGLSGPELDRRVEDLLERFSLPGFAHRKVAALSGGEKQRVALARALALEPALMLFDEPLASLDAGLRKDLRTELRSIQRRLGLTSVLVTHDQDDALSSADRVVVMHNGRVVRSGTPEEVYSDPRTVFVAGFLGDGNMLENLPGMPWFVPGCGGEKPCRTVFLRPEAFRPAGAPGCSVDCRDGDARMSVLVEDREFLGRTWLVRGRVLPAGGAASQTVIRFHLECRPLMGEAMDLLFDRTAVRMLDD